MATVNEITTDNWHVCQVNGIISSMSDGLRKRMTMLGERGYVKRNGHDKTQYQLVVLDIEGKVHVWYVPQAQAEAALEVFGVSSNQEKAQAEWSAGWSGYRFLK